MVMLETRISYKCVTVLCKSVRDIVEYVFNCAVSMVKATAHACAFLAVLQGMQLLAVVNAQSYSSHAYVT